MRRLGHFYCSSEGFWPSYITRSCRSYNLALHSPLEALERDSGIFQPSKAVFHLASKLALIKFGPVSQIVCLPLGPAQASVCLHACSLESMKLPVSGDKGTLSCCLAIPTSAGGGLKWSLLCLVSHQGTSLFGVLRHSLLIMFV